MVNVLVLLRVQFHAVTGSVKWIVCWIISNDGEDQNGMGYNALCALLSLDCRFRVTCFAQESTCILLSSFFSSSPTSSPPHPPGKQAHTSQPANQPSFPFISFFLLSFYLLHSNQAKELERARFGDWFSQSSRTHPFCHRQTETALIFQLNYKNAFLIRK